MKKTVLLAVAGLMSLAACQNQAGYTVKGTAEGVADGEYVYLQNFVDGNLVPVDSAEVKNGTFEFSCTPDSLVKIHYVTYATDNSRMIATFFSENGTINVALNPKASRVSGTSYNDLFQKIMDDYMAAREEMNSVWERMTTDSTLTEAQRDSISQVLDTMDGQNMDKMFTTISDNVANPVGVHLLASFGYAFDAVKVQPLLAQVPAGYAADKDIVALKEYVETAVKTSVGQNYIDFAMPTPDGKEIKLSDYVAKNKYTLIDFWASWCGPCRMEMPNVVAAYAKYKAKGLEIVGVSLDSNLESWKKAIKDLKITWPQMSDLQGWKSAGAGLYGVRSIPATVLVDGQGKIVARNLRGEELDAKLGELLK